jgi:hypothetical protein
MWTLQECLLPEDVEFRCGMTGAPSSPWIRAAHNCFKHRNSCCAKHGPLDAPKNLVGVLFSCLIVPNHYGKLCRARELKLLHLLGSVRHRQCTNPRDKIYGALGLMPNQLVNLLEPDYEKSTEQVYMDATVGIIQASSDLDIWTLMLPKSHTSKLKDMPSWGLDWSLDASSREATFLSTKLEQLSYNNASSRASVSLEVLGGNKIALKGVLVGRIVQLGEGIDIEARWWGKFSICRKWREMSGIDANPQKSYPILETPAENLEAAETLEAISGAISVLSVHQVSSCYDAFWLTLTCSLSPSNVMEGTMLPKRIRQIAGYAEVYENFWNWALENSGLEGIDLSTDPVGDNIGKFMLELWKA